MQKLLIDSSVIVRYLKNGSGILESLFGHYDLYVSEISLLEMQANKRASNEQVSKQLQLFMTKKFKTVQVDQKVLLKAAELLRSLDTLSLCHAIIAATSFSENIPLVTYDIDIFDQVPEIQLVEL
jgi:predicted nucleic acid-binding protein